MHKHLTCQMVPIETLASSPPTELIEGVGYIVARNLESEMLPPLKTERNCPNISLGLSQLNPALRLVCINLICRMERVTGIEPV